MKKVKFENHVKFHSPDNGLPYHDIVHLNAAIPGIDQGLFSDYNRKDPEKLHKVEASDGSVMHWVMPEHIENI